MHKYLSAFQSAPPAEAAFHLLHLSPPSATLSSLSADCVDAPLSQCVQVRGYIETHAAQLTRMRSFLANTVRTPTARIELIDIFTYAHIDDTSQISYADLKSHLVYSYSL